MKSVVAGETTAAEASDILQVNLRVIARVATRMTEQRLGVEAVPDSLIDYAAKLMLTRVMRRPW